MDMGKATLESRLRKVSEIEVVLQRLIEPIFKRLEIVKGPRGKIAEWQQPYKQEYESLTDIDIVGGAWITAYGIRGIVTDKVVKFNQGWTSS